MALSNWDTIAWNEKKEPTHGVFVSPQGVVVSVRKNWIQVFEKAEGDGVFPLLTVNSGSLRYKDVEIYAFRGPQQGVYLIVWSGFGSAEKPFTAMFAAGVYGYGQRERLKGNDTAKEVPFEGVREDSLFSFRMRIHDAARADEIPKTFEDIFPDRPLRFNQGDAFFAHHIGEQTPATKPGEAQPTTLSQVVDAWTSGEKTRKAKARRKK